MIAERKPSMAPPEPSRRVPVKARPRNGKSEEILGPPSPAIRQLAAWLKRKLRAHLAAPVPEEGSI
jgi:hypothetical protein